MGAGLDVPELFGRPPPRGASGHGRELSAQMRLVDIAALGSKVSERGRLPRAQPSGQEAARSVEAGDPCGCLGGEPSLGGEALPELTLTPADLTGQRSDIDSPSSGVNRAPRGDHRARRLQRGASASATAEKIEEPFVEDGKASVPGGRFGQPFAQRSSGAAEHFFGVEVAIGERTGGTGEERTGPKWVECHLHSGLAAIVDNQGRSCVKSTEEGVVAAWGLVRIGVGSKLEGILEGEDQRQPR